MGIYKLGCSNFDLFLENEDTEPETDTKFPEGGNTAQFT
jgi:hypothetical protein